MHRELTDLLTDRRRSRSSQVELSFQVLRERRSLCPALINIHTHTPCHPEAICYSGVPTSFRNCEERYAGREDQFHALLLV